MDLKAFESKVKQFNSLGKYKIEWSGKDDSFKCRFFNPEGEHDQSIENTTFEGMRAFIKSNQDSLNVEREARNAEILEEIASDPSIPPLPKIGSIHFKVIEKMVSGNKVSLASFPEYWPEWSEDGEAELAQIVNDLETGNYPKEGEQLQ